MTISVVLGPQSQITRTGYVEIRERMYIQLGEVVKELRNCDILQKIRTIV